MRALLRRLAPTEYIEQVLAAEIERAPLRPDDRALAQELVYGIVRWQAALDHLIERRTGPRPQKPAIQVLLRLGLYQIFWLDRIPEHAAVHETVELAKQLGYGPQAGFINALLRGCLRERDAIRAHLADLRHSQPAIGWSHPAWLVDRWTARWGSEAVARLLEWNNSPAPTYARINTLRIDPTALIERWRIENVEVDFLHRDWLEENLIFRLRSHPALETLATFREGCFYIQDPSTIVAVRLLDPRPGERILDLCSAPGGKTTFIAQLMRNEGAILAQDVIPNRLRVVEENARRLGIRIITTETASPAIPRARIELFDRVLVDAPCSNTGVMRRRVDLRWRIRPEEINRLRSGQLELLRRAAPQVSPGGTLVYSTCSLEAEENRSLVDEFLASDPRFRLVEERELVPFRDGVDGAYAARLARE